MTPEEQNKFRDDEHVRSMASEVFLAWSRACQDESFVKTVHHRYRDDPIYQEYMKDMGLTATIAAYVQRKRSPTND
jgi:hypothetical protein